MNKQKVYIAVEADADSYCGGHNQGVFSTEKKAKELTETKQ